MGIGLYFEYKYSFEITMLCNWVMGAGLCSRPSATFEINHILWLGNGKQKSGGGEKIATLRRSTFYTHNSLKIMKIIHFYIFLKNIFSMFFYFK